VDKVITIPAEPADPDLLPPALKPFGAVPPLVTDINLVTGCSPTTEGSSL
jgi:methanethiol oxidase